MRTINTAIGKLEICTLDKFLDLVPIKHTGADIVQYSTMVENFISVGFEPDGPSYETEYVRKICILTKGERKTVLRVAVASSLSVGHSWCKPLRDVCDDLVVKSLESLGDPTHLVRIAPRTWMVANPENFAIYEDGDRFGLVNYEECKVITTHIQKLTEQQVRDMIKLNAASFGADQ